ncbi:hypothetical protein [Williamsia soli]|uniref:hypothetical protein n=1 Tax=Williamsia soli TaxID=364929 RepID=UPI001A9CBCDD|nr:hypothetical protein [Williamsia soli]
MTRYKDDDTVAETHTAPADIPKAERPLIEAPRAAKVKIVGGMSEYALEDPPEYGEERTYIVKAWCKKVHLDEVDGEPRMVVDMLQTSIYERGKVPIVDEPQPGLFDADDETRTEGEPEALGDAMGLVAVPELPGDDEAQNGEDRKAAMFSDGGDEA